MKKIREALGLNQKAFANLLGVQRMTVWRWERGLNDYALNSSQIKILVDAARKIGWTADQLMAALLPGDHGSSC